MRILRRPPLGVSQISKPEPGVAVIPKRAELAEGQQAARSQKLAYAQGGFESPTLKLSGAPLTSSIGDTG